MIKNHGLLLIFLFLGMFFYKAAAQPVNIKVKSDADRQAEARATVQNYANINRVKLLKDGIAYLNEKSPELARYRIQRIYAVNPNDTEAVSLYALSRARSDQSYNPIPEYQRVLKLDPNDGRANSYLGQFLLDKGQAAEALVYLRKAIGSGGANYTNYWYSGRAALFEGDFQACVDDLTKALEKSGASDSANKHLYLLRAECNAEAGNSKAAKEDFAVAVFQQGGLKWAYSTRIFDDTGTRCKSNADSKYADALKNYDKNKIYEAYRDAHTAIKCDPKHLPALKLRQKIESEDDNLKVHAKVHAVQIERLENPNFKSSDAPMAADEKQLLSKSYLEKAEKSFASSDFWDVLDYANHVLTLDASNANALLLRSRAYVTFIDKSFVPLAWRDATAALKINSELALAYNVRGLVYENEKNYTAAIGEFEKALIINPNEEKPFYNRARMYSARGQFDKAAAAVNTLIAKYPTSNYYRFRSAVYYDLKDYPEALKSATKAIELDKSNVAAHYLLVITNDALGNRAAADDAHLWVLLNNSDTAKAPKLQSRPSLKDVQARYAAEITRRKNEETVARQNQAEANKRAEAADFKYKQQQAIAAYPQAHQGLEFALARYENAVKKYNAAGDAQYLFKGTLANIYRSLAQSRSIINTFLNKHGKYLPREMYDHLMEDFGKIPSSPY